MSSVQLGFSIRTSANVKTVHLVGSWDSYKNQLPLARDSSSSKAGAWKGAFRFPASAIKLGQRYWYYYILDGIHVCHDPAKDSTVEPTTGRELNILDVPAGKTTEKRAVAQGRALSPGRIQCPKPTKSYASRQLREADYTVDPESDDEEELSLRLKGTHLSARKGRSVSPASSITSASSASDCGSLSSVSARSSCTCERYGVTRKGDRVKLDCGGARCGYGSSDDSSDCSSDSEEEYTRARASQRRVAVRSSRR